MRQMARGHLVFEEREQPPPKQTRELVVLARRSRAVLGTIVWFGQWRQYCFFPQPECTFSHQCLDDVARTLRELNQVQEAHNTVHGTSHQQGV